MDLFAALLLLSLTGEVIACNVPATPEAIAYYLMP
jgi:hypothetical protein